MTMSNKISVRKSGVPLDGSLERWRVPSQLVEVEKVQFTGGDVELRSGGQRGPRQGETVVEGEDQGSRGDEDENGQPSRHHRPSD